MAEKRKGRKHNEEYVAPGEEVQVKPAKEEFSIAKWIRKNVPIKKTKFLNHNVEYFTGKRAVDALWESSYAKGDNAMFKSREQVVDFLHKMLENKFFHRARKVPVSESELKPKKKEKKSGDSSDDKEKSAKKDKDKGTDAESSVVEGKQEQTAERQKKKNKIKLTMHNDQRFVDSLDAYVWIYDPVPFHYWIMGTLLVLATIGMCLFPLWPSSVRTGVYYLSLTGIGFFVSIIVCVIIRSIIFCLIWLCTWGKHHLWILPNLTEEVGFFESFWPLYHYEYRGDGYVPKSKKDKKKKKDKDSDAEEEQPLLSETGDRLEEPSGPAEDEPETGRVEVVNGSESESESSQKSNFEMVDRDDVC